MRRCSGSGALVPLFTIRPRTSSPPALFPASSLAFPLTRLAGSFTTSRRVFPSQDVTFDESVPFCRLFPYRCAPPPPPPLYLAPGPPPVDPLPPKGPAPSRVSQVDSLTGTMPVEVAINSGAWSRGPTGALSRLSPRPLSPQQLREWFTQRTRLRSGDAGAGDSATGDTGAGGDGVTAGAGGTGGAAAAGPGGARTKGTGATGTGGVGDAGTRDPTEPGAAGVGGAGAVGAGAGGPGMERRWRRSRLSRVRTGRRVPRPRPHPVPSIHAVALRPFSVPLRVPLPPPLEFSFPTVPDPESDHACAAGPTISCLLATVVIDPSSESTAASALVAGLLEFTVACCLDYTTALAAESESASPPSVGGECALGTDVLEDRQEDFECLAPKGDSDAPDIPASRSYAEAITVDGMWIFRVKRPPGSPPAFQARYVARGFSQRQGVDYFQTFSQTPKMTTLRVLLHVAAQRDYELHSLDFSTAFLQGSLHEEIRLRFPPGFTGSFPAGTKWSLQRPAYGLRQVPREWHDTQRTTLAALGLTPSTTDPSLFLRTDTSLPPFFFLVYEDDLVFATADTEALSLVKSELQKRYTCTDLGELRNYLGLQITRDRARRTITLTQSQMVHQVLQHFGFQFSSPQPTPLSTGHSLSTPPSDESVEPSVPYPELVGCLTYLMTCTRPDLAYSLSLLARYVAPSRHRKVHWDAAKRVLHYLCGTSGMGLVLGERGLVVLIGHVDASWVDDSATQRSSQGYTFSLGSGSVS
ncbi:unnamed protein product [Closterium sp. NIES-54]